MANNVTEVLVPWKQVEIGRIKILEQWVRLYTTHLERTTTGNRDILKIFLKVFEEKLFLLRTFKLYGYIYELLSMNFIFNLKKLFDRLILYTTA